jgi:alpha-tubulin suppressor-like RCC1 family protein
MRRTLAWAFAAMCLSCEAVLGIAPLPGEDASSDAMTTDGASDVVTKDVADASTKDVGDACVTCGSTCVDLQNDPNNCGSCGHSCGDAGYGCVNGRCGNEVVDLSAGQFHACSVNRAGEVWCWGDNNDQQCSGPGGDNCFRFATYCRTPTKVAGITNAVGVASSTQSSCALDATGTVSCWGTNIDQQLGNDAGGGASSPVKVNLPDKVTQIAGGYAMVCAVTEKHELWCWGHNECGQMGLGFVGASDGGFSDDLPPQLVISGVESVRLSYPDQPSSACVAQTDGGVTCWGNDVYGSLGYSAPQLCYGTGGNGCDSTPKPFTFNNGAITVSPGLTSCGVASGTVYCWGLNNLSGQLGNGQSNNGSFSPVIVSTLPNKTFVDVQTSGYHSCALAKTGEVYCWGWALAGQIGAGYDDAGSAAAQDCGGTPCWTSAKRVGTIDATMVRVGGEVSYAVDDGGVWAWGWNDIAELGHAGSTNGDHVSDAGFAFSALPTRVPLP